MGFGQYSAGGGISRNKPELLSYATGDVAKSKLAGKNRLHFTRTDGSQGFILHQTIIAECSADKSRVTLGDGGWHTLTTKSAWGDAIDAFDLPKVERYFTPYSDQSFDFGDLGPDGVTRGYWTSPSPRIGRPTREQRSVTYERQPDNSYLPCEGDRDYPMIRADVDSGYGGNFAVRFTGSEIVSEAGARHRATPFKVLVVLLRIDALARATTSFHCMRGDALYQFSFEALGYTIHPGQSSRSMMVGCHTFQTTEFRAMLRRIGAEHPDALKAAKAFVRKHKTDFGMAEYKAAEKLRLAAYQARVAARIPAVA